MILKLVIGGSKLLWKTAPMLAVFILLATNVLSLVSATFHESAYRLLTSLPIEKFVANSMYEQRRQTNRANERLNKRNKALEKSAVRHKVRLTKARNISKRIARRTARNATMNLSSVVGESVPYLGAGVIVAVTAADLKDGCDTLTDIDEMLSIIDAEAQNDMTSHVCGMQVPSVEEVMLNVRDQIGGTVSQAKENTTEAARNFYETLGGTIAELLR